MKFFNMLVVIGVPGLLGACASMSQIDIPAQTAIVRQELKGEEILNATKCSYLTAKFGGMADAMLSAFCFSTARALYVRVVDTTNPQFGTLKKFSVDQMKNYSVYKFAITGMDELQIRTDGTVHGVIGRADGVAFDNAATNRLAQAVGTMGISKGESLARIPVRPSDTTTYIYVPPPKRQ
jgi:hypothetical protein